MASSGVELTVVLPALNERECLTLLLPRVRAALDAMTVRHEIIVVDGGSVDGTEGAALAARACVIREAGGFGEALRAGFEAAAGKWILVMDADGSHPPQKIAALWALRERADLVAASRFCEGGSAQMPRWRFWASRALNAATSRVLGLPIRDASSGFRLYRAEIVRGLPGLPADFSAQQTILAHVLARGGRATEVPFHYEPRLSGQSKARPLAWAGSFLRMFLRVPAIQNRQTPGKGLP